jgi:glutathione synthase/RimK-type ligase-like ATP-grasp enzyme
VPQKSYKSNCIEGKLRVYRYLSAHPHLKSYQPYTAQLDKNQLKQCLQKYGLVYVKPNKGSHGNGICQVKKVNNHNFILRSAEDRRTFRDVSSLYNYLASRSNALLAIQQGIPLERVEGKPYDIRSMVQRKPGGVWKSTGIFTKVGTKNKIVTNYSQGGRIVLLEKVFASLGQSAKQRKQRYRKLKEVSLAVAHALSSSQPGMHEMGIDFAFDRKGKLWILEVNTRHPQFHPLKELHPKMYQRMMALAKSYGRTRAK